PLLAAFQPIASTYRCQAATDVATSAPAFYCRLFHPVAAAGQPGLADLFYACIIRAILNHQHGAIRSWHGRVCIQQPPSNNSFVPAWFEPPLRYGGITPGKCRVDHALVRGEPRPGG